MLIIIFTPCKLVRYSFLPSPLQCHRFTEREGVIQSISGNLLSFTEREREGGGNSEYIRKSTVCRKFYKIINAVQFPVKYRGKFSQLHKMEIIWEKIDSDGCVSPREGQCSCVTENSMYMFGGVLHTDDLTETNDLLRFSFGKIHRLYIL